MLSGQTAQIRIFEKRYQLLVKHLVEHGGCFGFPIDKDVGVTAVVRR
jgi:Lon protease-like protein